MTAPLDERIASIRRFNRFYTRKINVLQEGFLGSSFSLAEGRVLYELAHRPGMTASMLSSELGLDPGYLSRILDRFAKRGLIERTPSTDDRRQRLLALTAAGSAAFAPLDQRSREEIGALLAPLSEPRQRRLVEAMEAVETLLASAPPPPEPYVLRPPRPGDFGWIVHRHGVLYAEEYGWNQEFEALVAEITAKIVQNWDARRECWWIAEREGEILGSVCLVRSTDEVAKLRLLIVEPKVRGQGIGRRLVEECIRFARRTGYRKITLWTNSVLGSARHIYERAGFQCVASEPYHSFGVDLVSETWDLAL